MRIILSMLAAAICAAFAIAATSLAHPAEQIERGGHQQYAAVAFDYLVLFDPDSVAAAVDRIISGRSREFTQPVAHTAVRVTAAA